MSSPVGVRMGAQMMLREGAKVAISDIDFEAAQATAHEIGGNVMALPLDVTSLDQWHDAVREVRKAFGGLNVLVNNAGIIVPGSVESLSDLHHLHRRTRCFGEDARLRRRRRE